MSTTYRLIEYDIKMICKQQFPDAEFTGNSILFWILTFENFVKYRHLQTTETGAYLYEFEDVPVVNDGERNYFTLPASIYDLNYEKGINYISYNESDVIVRFQQTEANRVHTLYWNPYTKPSSTNPYFYRVNTNVYLLGLPLSAPTVQVGLYSAVETRPDYVNIDSVVTMNEEQITAVRQMVLELGRFALLTPKDRIESGTDDKQENLQAFAKGTQMEQPQQEQQ